MRARYVRLARRLLRCAAAAVVLPDDADAAPLLAAVETGPVRLDDVAGASATLLRAVAQAAATAARGGRPAPVRAVIAVPVGRSGTAHGVLLALEPEPRAWGDVAVAMLADLAAGCAGELAAARPTGAARRPSASLAELDDLTRNARALLGLSEGLAGAQGVDDVAHVAEMIGLIQFGCGHVSLWLRDGEELEQVRPRGPRAPTPARLPLSDDHPLGETTLLGQPRVAARRGDLEARYGRSDDLRVGPGRGARLFLPVVQGDAVAGALLLAWDQPRDLADAERPVYDALASYVGQAVQRLQLVEERRAALLTLQESLLPRIPVLPGLAVCARYRPSAALDHVGGDWYDAVPLGGGRALAVVGDVVGHDLRAASTMGQLRTVLRTLAWDRDAEPAAVLARLDEAMVALDVPGLATLVLARLEVSADGTAAVTWSSAGHPPPLVLAADGEARVLEAAPELMVGVECGSERHDHDVVLAPGDTLLLYTDGLVERSGEHLDRGLERLRASLSTRAALTDDLDALVDAVLDDLLGARPCDDVALLAVRVPRDEVAPAP